MRRQFCLHSAFLCASAPLRLAGGPSERLRQSGSPHGRQIRRARDLADVGEERARGAASAGVDAQAFDPAQREVFDLKREGFERVFIALHGRYGEDGTVQGALELMGIPYTGSGVMASALAMDKVRTKMVWVACGLPTPRWEVLRADSDWAGVAARLGLPLIVKPAHEGSTLGLTKVTRAEELAGAFEAAARLRPAGAGRGVRRRLGADGGLRGRAGAAADPHRGAAGTLRLPEQVFQRRDPVLLPVRPGSDKRSAPSRTSSCARPKRSAAADGAGRT